MNTNSSWLSAGNPYQGSEIERCPGISHIVTFVAPYKLLVRRAAIRLNIYTCVVCIENFDLAEGEIKGFLYAARVLKKITI